MAKIKIDEIEYELNDLNEEVKGQLVSIQFIDVELQRLNAQTAVYQTARLAYSKALQANLSAVQLNMLGL